MSYRGAGPVRMSPVESETDIQSKSTNHKTLSPSEPLGRHAHLKKDAPVDAPKEVVGGKEKKKKKDKKDKKDRKEGGNLPEDGVPSTFNPDVMGVDPSKEKGVDTTSKKRKRDTEEAGETAPTKKERKEKRKKQKLEQPSKDVQVRCKCSLKLLTLS